jgi:hypothetical protein
MKLENSNQTELPSQGMMSPLSLTKFLLDTLLSIIHARTSSNIYGENLNKLKKLYHKKQGLLLLKCLLVPKHVKKQKDGGKKDTSHLVPRHTAWQGPASTHICKPNHPPPTKQKSNHTTQKSKKKGGATMKLEKLRPCKLPQRSNYKETRETEPL